MIVKDTQQVLALVSTQHSKELENYKEFDNLILQYTDKIKSASDFNKALEYSLKVSHVIFNYRVTLQNNLNSLRDTINKFDTQVKARMKIHEQLILQRLQSLDSYRSDLELIQRLSYANRITF